MAEPIGSLRAELSANHAQFTSDMGKARRSAEVGAAGMSKAMDKAKKSFDSSFLSLKSLAAMAGSVYIAGKIIKMADEYTLLDNKLKLVTKSSADLSAVQDGLYEQSLRSHSSYSSSVDLYSRFAKATESIGTSQKDLLRITETLNKAMIISGATQEEAKNGIIQLSQGMASGVLRGEEFNSIMENGSRIARMLSDYLQVDIGQLRKMAAEGQITSETMIKAFSAAAGTIDEEFGKMQPTIAQAMTDLQTVFGRLVSDANKGADGTRSVADEIRKLAETIDQNRSGIIELFTLMLSLASKVVKAMGNIGQSIRGWGAVGRGQLGILDFATMNAEDLSKWLEKNDNQLAMVSKRLEDARLEWVKWNNLTKQYPSTDPNSKFNAGATAAAKKYNDILKERTAIIQKQTLGDLSGGGLGFPVSPVVAPKTTTPKATKATKSDIISEYDQLEIIAKDNLERVQDVWEENEEWMKTHYFDPITGMYIEMSDAQLSATENTVDLAKDQFEDLKSTIEGWGRESADAIADFAMGGKTSFKDMIDSMIKDLLRMMIYQNITKPLASSVSGVISGLFSGGSGGGEMFAGGAWSSPAGEFTGGGLGVGGRASGGPVSAGKMYEVNERGIPEILNIGNRQFLMMAGRNGYVEPSSGGATGGNSLSISIPITMEGSKKLASELRVEVEQTVEKVIRRNS